MNKRPRLIARLPDNELYEPHTVVQLLEALSGHFPNCEALIRFQPKKDGSCWTTYRAHVKALGAVIQETMSPVEMNLAGFFPPNEFYSEDSSWFRRRSRGDTEA